MITTPADYLSLLYLIQSNERQTVIINPPDEKIYNIDLNTRLIDAPNGITTVERDHNAETIYFMVDRYFDSVDLARDDIFIVIQYENNNPNPKKRGFIYAPPFIDVTTYKNKILFPWAIEGPATEFAGNVNFSIKFYRLNFTGEYEYQLNTLPCKLKVQHGMNIYENSENYILPADEIEKIYQRIEEVSRANDVYWLKLG